MTEHHHIFELFDESLYVQAFELDGKDHTVTIARVRGATVEGDEGRKSKKPVLDLEEWSRPVVLNKTNARMLIRFYGPDYRQWAGKQFVMYPTQVKFGREMVDAIRIRSERPSPAKSSRPAKPLPERIAAFRDALKSATTEQEVKDVVAKASGLFDAVDSETRDALGLEWNARLDDVRVIEQQRKERVP